MEINTDSKYIVVDGVRYVKISEINPIEVINNKIMEFINNIDMKKATLKKWKFLSISQINYRFIKKPILYLIFLNQSLHPKLLNRYKICLKDTFY